MNEEVDYSYYNNILTWANSIVGTIHVFPDGKKLEVIQVKRRDTGPWVFYLVHDVPGVPKKLVMHVEEFRENFGHLFGDEYFDEDF